MVFFSGHVAAPGLNLPKTSGKTEVTSCSGEQTTFSLQAKKEAGFREINLRANGNNASKTFTCSSAHQLIFK